MRHRVRGRKLNLTTAHRRLLLANLSSSLITHEQIRTTLPRARELRPFVEKLISFAKRGGLHGRRRVYAVLRDNVAVAKLWGVLAGRYKARPGGYTRVLKAGLRRGDAAPMAVIEFVERNVEARGRLDKERHALERERRAATEKAGGGEGGAAAAKQLEARAARAVPDASSEERKGASPSPAGKRGLFGFGRRGGSRGDKGKG